MNLEALLEKFRNDPRIARIADATLLSSPQQIRLVNLTGSAAEFLVSAVYMHPSTHALNHLVILNDAEEAAYFHNTLESLIRPIDLFYFPRIFTTPWKA